MVGVKTAWYKTRWGTAALAGVVGIGLGSGVAANKEQTAVPASYTTVSVTPSPIVETATATVTETVATTETAMATETATATVAVTETVQSTPVPTSEQRSNLKGISETTSRAQETYYKNCKEVKAAGAAPIRAGDPGYRSELDRDGDGIACEK